MKRLSWFLLPIVAFSCLTSCSSTPAAQDSTSPGADPVTIRVLAAASLKNVFPVIGEEFESTNTGCTVDFAFGGSATLVGQIIAGASGDVLATADVKNMDKAKENKLVDDSTIFVKNTLTIAVAPGNPKNITKAEDLTNSTLKVVLCDPEQPCGRLAREYFTENKIDFSNMTSSSDASTSSGLVMLGEADATLVYTTDVKGSKGKLDQVDLVDAPTTQYPIAVLTNTNHKDCAQAFVDTVLGAKTALTDAGFAMP